MRQDCEAKGRLSIAKGEALAPAAEFHGETIAAYLEEATSRWADHEALVLRTSAGRVSWTYSDLRARSLEVARALVADGLGKGGRVGILMSNRPEYLSVVFGVALAGGVVVALNSFATPNELEYLLRSSGVETLLFESHVAKKDFSAMLAKIEPAIAAAEPARLVSARLPFLRRLVALHGEGAQQGQGALIAWEKFLRLGDAIPEGVVIERTATLAASDTAILFYSSGSTGLPKGVLHSQRAVVLQWRRWPMAMGQPGELRAWTANGFFWSGNFVMAIGSALSTGGALILQTTFDPAEAIELMEQERVNAPLAMLHQWGRIADEPIFQSADLRSLTYLDPRYAGVHQPTIPTTYRQPQAFGCTETLTINTTTWFGEDGPTREEGHGLPLPGNTLKIVDPQTGEVVPRGQRGELAIRGPTLMQGYLGKTAEECFDDEGFFHTGDGGYLDDSGWLFWEGRLTDIIKTGGANVSPMEVDGVITSYPGVKATQTVGLPHDSLGEIVVSCIVPLEGVELDLTDLQQFLKQRLASYKLPRRMFVVGDEELTLTASGNKIKASEVRSLAAARMAAGQDHVSALTDDVPAAAEPIEGDQAP